MFGDFHSTVHISLFMDDVLPFLNNTASTNPKFALLLLSKFHDDITEPFRWLNHLDILEWTFSLEATANKNYWKALRNVKADLERWTRGPLSFQARISVLTMNLLPRINFVSAMLPLTSPWLQASGKRYLVQLQSLFGTIIGQEFN